MILDHVKVPRLRQQEDHGVNNFIEHEANTNTFIGRQETLAA